MWRHIKPILQVNHTDDLHVGFLFPQFGIWKHNKISHEIFSSYHNTILQLMSCKNISAHTYMKFEILLGSKSKIAACFVVFLHTVLPNKETKE